MISAQNVNLSELCTYLGSVDLFDGTSAEENNSHLVVSILTMLQSQMGHFDGRDELALTLGKVIVRWADKLLVWKLSMRN